MRPQIGDIVQFKKSFVPISGRVTSLRITHVEEDGTVWLRLTFATKSEFTVKEDEIEITTPRQYARSVS